MRAAALGLILLAAPAMAQTPDMQGPYGGETETDTIAIGPSQVSTTVCVPGSGGPWPMVAIAYPTLDSASTVSGLCLHLATWGVLAVVPDQGFANTDYNSVAATLLGALSYFTGENSRSGSHFNGKLDPAHRAVVGYSTAAIGALLAVQQDPTLSVAVGLDPEDYNALAENAAGGLDQVPILSYRADPALCNGQGNWDAVYAALPGPKSSVHVYASNLCDAEDPTSSTCPTTCGATYAYAALMFSRYATAAVLFYAACQSQMRTWIDGAGLASDLQMHSLDTSESQGLPDHCGPFVAVDAGADSGADAGEAPQGCGCSPPAEGGPASALWMALALGGAVAVRGRRVRRLRR